MYRKDSASETVRMGSGGGINSEEEVARTISWCLTRALMCKIKLLGEKKLLSVLASVWYKTAKKNESGCSRTCMAETLDLGQRFFQIFGI